jgi:hypothetical protein
MKFVKPNLRYALSVFLGLGLVIASGMANAQTTVTLCQDLIGVTSTTLAGTDIGGNNPAQTRASLQSKLDGASIKLIQAKFCDSFKKLAQFQDKVTTLAVPNAKGEVKMNAEDANTLATEAGEALACVLELDSTCTYP